MRRLTIAIACSIGLGGAAFSADLAIDPIIELAAPSAANYDWTGFYLGGVAGYGWGDSEHCDASANPPCQPGFPHFDLEGGTGGVTLGYNWQAVNWVFGIEADYSWGDIDGTSPGGGFCGAGGATCNTDIESYGTVRGRLGYAFDRILPYLTAGVAFSQLHASILTGAPTESGDTTTATSFTVGGGVEFAFGMHWSGKIEYLYVDSPNDFDYDILSACVVNCFTSDNSFHTVRVGVNYLFASDRRLKRYITHIATLETGIKLYRFKYLWDEQVHVGVMAQDLLGDEAFRHAVVMTQNGYYAVNYEMLGLKMATLEVWRDYGLAAVSLQSPGSRVSSLMENVSR